MTTDGDHRSSARITEFRPGELWKDTDGVAKTRMEAVVAGRDAGSRLAAGRLVLDRLCRLYDLFASLVNVENTYVRKFTLRVSP